MYAFSSNIYVSKIDIMGSEAYRTCEMGGVLLDKTAFIN